MRKKILILLGILIVVLIILLITKMIINSQNNSNKPQPGATYDVITEQSQKQLDKDTAIGLLIKKLPYNGQKFTLKYSIDGNQFVVGFKRMEQVEALKELDNFLKSNNIQDQNWLYNLKLEYH